MVLRKIGDDAWCYCLSSWRTGPPWVPDAWREHRSDLSLARLLDKISQDSARWAASKDEHPEFRALPGAAGQPAPAAG